MEGEASCFKERKKINLYFNLDVNWCGGRLGQADTRPRESPPASLYLPPPLASSGTVAHQD